MQKEIFEQPMAVANTLQAVTRAQSLSANLFGAGAEDVLSRIRQILILACGTSYHAGMVARYWLEGIAGVPCNVEIASECRYRQSVPDPRTLDRAAPARGAGANEPLRGVEENSSGYDQLAVLSGSRRSDSLLTTA